MYVYCFVSVQVYPKSLDGFTMRPAKVAVQGISLAIPTGECFGLLGVNGTHTTEDFTARMYECTFASPRIHCCGCNRSIRLTICMYVCAHVRVGERSVFNERDNLHI